MNERAPTAVPLRWRSPLQNTTRAGLAQRGTAERGESGNGSFFYFGIRVQEIVQRVCLVLGEELPVAAFEPNTRFSYPHATLGAGDGRFDRQLFNLSLVLQLRQRQLQLQLASRVLGKGEDETLDRRMTKAWSVA
jgi:hypothetical protein